MPTQYHVVPAQTSTTWWSASTRLVDVIASSVGLVVLAPIFVMIALAIRIDDGGPVLFRQIRVGRWEKPFSICKFRSMRPDSSLRSDLTVGSDPRITRVGAFLRRYKLDELPQLFNVLTGDMSLVGPRPETPELAEHYDSAQRAVMFSVRPGITDYASLLLRDESVILAGKKQPGEFYRQKLMPLKYELCELYTRETGAWTDMRIVLATLWNLVFSSAPNPLIDTTLSDRVQKLRTAEFDNGS